MRQRKAQEKKRPPCTVHLTFWVSEEVATALARALLRDRRARSEWIRLAVEDELRRRGFLP